MPIVKFLGAIIGCLLLLKKNKEDKTHIFNIFNQITISLKILTTNIPSALCQYGHITHLSSPMFCL